MAEALSPSPTPLQPLEGSPSAAPLTQGASGAKTPVLYLAEERGADKIEEWVNHAMYEYDSDRVMRLIVRTDETLRQECPNLRTENPHLYRRYETMFAKAKWFVLERMGPGQAEDLLKNHFQYFFAYELEEVLRKLHVILFAYPEWSGRDLIKTRWRNAIAKSDVNVDDALIEVAGAPQQQPTVGNFIRDFRDFLHERQPSPLFIVEYLNTSPNFLKQSQEARTKVEKVLKLYAELTKSSLTPEGLEERVTYADPTSGTYKVLEYGEVRDTGAKISPARLKEMRDIAGLDEGGRPLSSVKLVKKALREEQELGLPVLPAEPPEPPVVKESASPSSLPAFPPPPRAPVKLPPTPREVAKVAPPPPPSLPVMPPLAKRLPTPALLKPVVPPTPPSPLRQRTSTLQPPLYKKLDYVLVAQRTLSEHKLLFPTLEIEQRFLNILVAYLQGTRARNETRAILTRPHETGGAGLTKEITDRVLETAQRELRTQQERPLAEDKGKRRGAFVPTLEEIEEQLKERKDERKEQHARAQARQGRPEDILASTNPIFDIPLEPIKKGLPLPHVSIPVASKVSGHAKTIVRDITAPLPLEQEVLGPIEELGQMDLLEFRRLSPDPRGAAQKILYQLQLLEGESLVKKDQGITAWQKSPLNQLYLSIGNQSLEQSLPIMEVIRMRQERSEETLTELEFNAISDCNRQMRY